MKILVVMKNWLGDLLFQMPALDLIRQRYPEALITCVAPERCREILEAHPAVSGFLSFDEKSTHRSWLARWQFLAGLRKVRPWDQGYLFHRSRTRALLLLLAGVRERIGFGKGRKLFLTRALPEPARSMHQLDYFFDLMQKAGYDLPEEKVYRFYYKEEDMQRAEEILRENGLNISPSHCEGVRQDSWRTTAAISSQKNKIASPQFLPSQEGAGARNDAVMPSKYICFHLGANWEPKRWPPAHFAALADKIHDRWQFPIVVTGSSQDMPLFEAFASAVHKAKIVPLVGKTPLRVSACIYKNAKCLVTGDSGPMHIASGVGASVVALFGPTDPELTGPRGTGDKIVLQFVPPGYSVPFFGKDFPDGGWLSNIPPEQVMDAVERILPK